jgi:hypothetical protein
MDGPEALSSASNFVASFVLPVHHPKSRRSRESDPVTPSELTCKLIKQPLPSRSRDAEVEPVTHDDHSVLGRDVDVLAFVAQSDKVAGTGWTPISPPEVFVVMTWVI